MWALTLAEHTFLREIIAGATFGAAVTAAQTLDLGPSLVRFVEHGALGAMAGTSRLRS